MHTTTINMDLFDVFLQYNVDFSLTVTHDADKVYVSFLPRIPSSKTPSGVDVKPISITINKGESVDAADVQAKIKTGLNLIGDAFAPLEEQVKGIQEAIQKKEAAKSVKEAKKSAKKDDGKVTAFNIKSKSLLAAKTPVLDDIKAQLLKVSEYNKEKNKDVSPNLLKEFDKLYKEMNELKDKLEPSLFGGEPETDEEAVF
jgi:phage protein D